MATVVKTKIGAGGRLGIPAAFRNELGLRVGDDVIISCTDGEIRVSTIHERVRRVQEFINDRIVPRGPSIVDELIADRRAEAESE